MFVRRICLCYLLATCLAFVAECVTLLELLGHIKAQDNYNCVLLMKAQNDSIAESKPEPGLLQGLMTSLQTPVMQLDERVTYFLYRQQSNQLITLLYMANATLEQQAALLKALVANLRLMTTTRVVLLLQQQTAAAVDENYLGKLFLLCWQSRLLNVLALYENFEQTQVYYSYTAFPSFKLLTRNYEQQARIFVDRLNNLQGFELNIVLGGSTPRLIAYYDKHGSIVYRGTLGHFMDAFAQRYNCKLRQKFPAKPNEFQPSTELVKAVRNGSADISMAITYPTIPVFGFSYPYELMHWCLVLPVEPDVPPAQYYLKVFELETLLLTLALLLLLSVSLTWSLRSHGYAVHWHEFLVHNNCLRGILGQPFNQVFRAPIVIRMVYVQICLLGFLLTAWYNSYFSAFVTSVPKESLYRSFDDVLASKLQVIAWQPEYMELLGRLVEYRKYAPMFLVEPDFGRYISMRDSFNTKYGYMMPTTKWVVVNEQQKIFSKPLFFMRADFCFFNNVPLCFVVHENSIYMESLYSLILVLAERGLTSHWTKSGFSEQVAAGELSFQDLSTRREFRAMQLDDLKYIWYGYAVMILLSSTVLLLELSTSCLQRRCCKQRRK